jgi:hypothetical protein
MKQIAVIGAGTMGNGIAHTFAQSGFTVKLIDISEQSLDRGMATIASNLDRMVAKGTISEADKLATVGNIITYTDIQDGVVGVDLVVEAETENVNLKEAPQTGENSVSQLINSIPNEKYFYLADEEADFWFNPEEVGPNYNWTEFDWSNDGDLVDYFYDDIFNNELKGKPGVEGNNFNEWQDSEREKSNKPVGPNVTLLVNKIKSIITDYKKLNFNFMCVIICDSTLNETKKFN